MSLNWKEINLILEELSLEGAQIQKVVQSAFDVLSVKLYGKTGAKNLLICISPGACRIHETFFAAPKSDKPLRFAEFLNSNLVNSRIEEAVQLGNDRIIRITVRRTVNEDDEERQLIETLRFRIYIRLWSNAANMIVTDMDGKVLDAMRRLPKKKEVSGGVYMPEQPPLGGADTGREAGREYSIREFPEDLLTELGADASFNKKIDAFYRREGGALSLEALKEEARRKFEGSIGRLGASLERLREKEADFSDAWRFKEEGDRILSEMGPPAEAVKCYERYKKARAGLAEVRNQIEEGKKEMARLEETLGILLAETNPLVLHKLLNRHGGGTDGAMTQGKSPFRRDDAKRPGLSFRRKDWLIIVGRDASENDTLLRKFVKGNDLWLHARDFPGSYVFIKQRAGKTVPLDILLDAGNLALFYSKGRNNGEGDLFYTPVKYLRRAKNGPKGLVIPTQEKNLHVKVESKRLRELEACKVEK